MHVYICDACNTLAIVTMSANRITINPCKCTSEEIN